MMNLRKIAEEFEKEVEHIYEHELDVELFDEIESVLNQIIEISTSTSKTLDIPELLYIYDLIDVIHMYKSRIEEDY